MQAPAGIPNSNPKLRGKDILPQTWGDPICEASVCRAGLITSSSGTRYDTQMEPSGAVMCQEEKGRAQWDVKGASPVLGRAEAEERGRAGHG